MEIPLQTKGTDIYSFGFDSNLNRNIPDNSTGVVYDSVNQTNTGSVVPGGNLTLKTLSIGGLVRQVAPGDDIQAAIDAVNREGGGTVQLLAKTYNLTRDVFLKSNVVLAGAGRDVTIIDFAGAPFAIKAHGNSTTDRLEDFSIRDLSVQNSAAAIAVSVDYSRSFVIADMYISGCVIGFSVKRSDLFDIRGVDSSTNTSHGFQFTNDSAARTDYFSVSDCRADNNTGTGYLVTSAGHIIGEAQFSSCQASGNGVDGFRVISGDAGLGGGIIYRLTFVGCISDSNTGTGFAFITRNAAVNRLTLVACQSESNTVDGFDFSSTVFESDYRSLLNGCTASSNASIGFDTDSSSTGISFVASQAESNTGDGFELGGKNYRVVGCKSDTPYDLQAKGVFVGNIIESSVSTDPKVQAIVADTLIQSYSNYAESTRTERKFLVAKNSSGAALRSGNVVVFAAASGGDEVTTTTTNGSNKVFGKVAEDIASAEWGGVLTEGYTTDLYVSNGTASIAIGDWLSTYSHAYYAKKAVTGDMVFAMALSTPTTSTASISALLVTPRLI